jgi:CubicO group peptidase (beta-lactamase class C family)
MFLAIIFLSAAALLGTSQNGASQRMADAQIVQDLRSHLDRLVVQDRFSGAVLLAKNSEVLFEQAYGFANHAFGARNNVDTKFNLASDGKMFTAVAIMQLAEQGKLRLDETVLKQLPDYPNKEVASKITVRELLTHKSGLGDIFGKEYFDANPTRFWTLESYLPLFASKPLLFEPGTKSSYSNAGYVVLGLVIERVSGESYYKYIQDNVFNLAGMSDTGCYSVSDDVPNLALGYTRLVAGEVPGGRTQASEAPRRVTVSLSRGSSAGGCYSTVGDMLRFAQAAESHKLVNQEYTNQLMTGEASDWMGPMTRLEHGSGVRVVGHAGGAPGISTWLDMYPDLGYTVVVLSNYDDGAGLVNDRLRWELTGHELPQEIQLSASVLAKLAGHYKPPAPAPGMSIMWHGQPQLPPIGVLAERDGLQVDLSLMGEHRFLPLSPTEFFDADSPGTRLSFTETGTGQIVSLSISGPRIHLIGAAKLP